jgi:hypothetical protein
LLLNHFNIVFGSERMLPCSFMRLRSYYEVFVIEVEIHLFL